jgi:hypothetical protein
MRDGHAQRLRRYRSRLAVRAWEYRQRHHAHGVWSRLRRLLAEARRAYVITDEDARQLLAEGRRPEPVGAELAPAKTIVFAPAERIARLAGAREIPVRLEAALLDARCLVLERFPYTSTKVRGGAGDV